jgi:hypothetical protein
VLLDIVSRLVFVRHGRDMYTPDGAKDPNTSAPLGFYPSP